MAFIQKKVIDVLGSGITWPITLVNGRPPIETGKPLIQSSMKIVIQWPLFTRVMLGQFGSRINEILEEPNDNTQKQLMTTFFKDSLTMWEKRIEFIGINFEDNNMDELKVRVFYRIITQANIDSFIFPFRKNFTY